MNPKPKTKSKKNISNNFRGKEDIFWIKIKKGIKKFLEPAFKEK